MSKIRKTFFVMATGGHETEKHYYDTIERKKTLEEAQRFLTSDEIKIKGR